MKNGWLRCSKGTARGWIVAGALFLSGCFVFNVPVEYDRELGERASREVVEQIGLYQAPEPDRYVRDIGERLFEHLDDHTFQFAFNIADQPEPNAFALPGGHVYVSRGLLVLANTEDELAGVMGHEIIHVTKRHAVRRMKRGILPGILSIPGKIVGSVISEDVGNLINAPVDAMGSVMLASYSRGNEKEADRLGMRLAAKSGYEPGALATMLSQLEAANEAQTGKPRRFSFFDSHPMTPNRVKDIDKEAASVKWTRAEPIAKNRRDFLGRMDGIPIEADPSLGIFDGRQFLHPDMNFSITFPEGWKTINTPSAVGAFAAKKEALVVLGVAGRDPNPDKLAAELIDRLRREHKIEPTESRSVEFGEWHGQLVTYADTSGKVPETLHFLWVRMGQLTYQMIGIGPDKFRESLKQTAMSFRPLTQEERDGITVDRLRSAEAMEGETLEALGRRTGNTWTASYTAIVNGLPEKDPLKAGMLIKISHREPYRVE